MPRTVSRYALLFIPFALTFLAFTWRPDIPKKTGLVQKQKLSASVPGIGDQFGFSIATDGETTVVGAHGDDTAGGLNAGSAYVFVRSGGTWLEQAQLTALDGAAGDEFGYSVAVSEDTLVVGFLSGETRRQAFEVDLLREICDKKLTGKCLVVTPTALAKEFDFLKNVLSLELAKPLSDLYLPTLFVLVGQCLGLFASLREGLRPDEPSPRGAISRVVSHVKIH